jgi:hypothetical protein
MNNLPNQTVDHVAVQLPNTFSDYRKKKYITVYNCTAELIRNETNITPKHICPHCNLANPSNTIGVVDYSLFTYYKKNLKPCSCYDCVGQVNCNTFLSCFKCGDCNKCKLYTNHIDSDLNKNLYKIMQSGNNYIDFVGLINSKIRWEFWIHKHLYFPDFQN